MNVLISSDSIAAEHIKVVREIYIDHAAAESIIQTPDKGYVVAGTMGKASATRVDASGKILWQYLSESPASAFHDVAILPDNSVILCGEVKEKKSSGNYILGLLTHLDQSGKVISEKHVTPAEKPHGITELNHCFPFKDGIAVLGNKWLFLLDNKGDIKWEKYPYDIGFERVVLLSDESFATHTGTLNPGTFESNIVKRSDASGNLVATRLISNWSRPVQELVKDNSMRVLMADDKGHIFLDNLNEKLESIKKAQLSVDIITPQNVFGSNDGSLMLFGHKELGENAVTAAIEWISSDLIHKEIFLFEPHYSTTIRDVIPTDIPGEFAVAREIWPMNHFMGKNETRLGIVITFVQIR